ncbi:MAG: restriction endonuclease subunit S [Bacteroidetes bacterium CHB5]|nr:restriction endonuclease subunit S [Bacteroidetes bacterium CHB5]
MGSKVNIKSTLSGFFAGFSFRQKVENDPKGDLHVIQMKDLEHSYSSIGMNLTKIKSDKISNKALLKKGDVLLITKGANNYAVEYKHDFEKAVAASAFYVLRPDQNKINPSYLTWYINQPPVQQYFKANMAGTYIPNLNKGTIEEIVLVVPPMEIQNMVVALDDLRRQEYVLMTELIEKRKTFTAAALLDIVNK